jgi:signal transduction histidine kinase
MFPDKTQAIHLDALPVATLLVGERGHVLFANRIAVDVLERRQRDLRGALIDTVLAPLDCLLERAETRVRGQRALPLKLPTGRQITVGFVIGAATMDDGTKGYSVLFQDISDWVVLDDEHDRLLKLAGVSSILPTLLHEIKNTLASITITAEVILEEVETEPLRHQVHALLSELRRMKLSLDGVATVGRSLRSSRHSAIDQACRDAWQIMAARARTLGIFSRSSVEDMPLLLLDSAVVGGLVHNLMLNAIQACSRGQSVNLQARLREDGTRFTLIVVDNGPGMTAEVYERCTELFFSTKRNGSGIGLALCRRIAEAAGGTMTIESVLGFGTSVTVDVPCRPPPSPMSRGPEGAHS